MLVHSMLSAVYFDDETVSHANKIENVPVARHLSPEMKSARTP
jgi:hypothetical protein